MSKMFQLQAGRMIHSFNQPTPITNDNLTDEKAIEILKEAPGAAKFFEVIPENWKELVENYNPKAKEEEGEAVVSEEASPVTEESTPTAKAEATKVKKQGKKK